jgi:hypothetical protein
VFSGRSAGLDAGEACCCVPAQQGCTAQGVLAYAIAGGQGSVSTAAHTAPRSCGDHVVLLMDVNYVHQHICIVCVASSGKALLAIPVGGLLKLNS